MARADKPRRRPLAIARNVEELSNIITCLIRTSFTLNEQVSDQPIQIQRPTVQSISSFLSLRLFKFSVARKSLRPFPGFRQLLDHRDEVSGHR